MNITPNLPEPTEAEIKQTKQLIKDKYDTVLPESELVKLVSLINELEWWQKTDAKPGSPREFSEDQLADLKELLAESGSQDLSPAAVRDHAHTLLVLVPAKEKQRLAAEIRGILVEHRPVPYEPVVAEKTVALLKARYDATLTDEQMEQLVPLLARTLWYSEGLDTSLEKCLDDLMRRKDSELHKEVSKTLDSAITKLKK